MPDRDEWPEDLLVMEIDGPRAAKRQIARRLSSHGLRNTLAV